jgi:quercetin dioxygenase-like cupin family protein
MGTIHRQQAGTVAPTWLYPTVPITEYRTGTAAGITRQMLIGQAEGTGDFLLRYFTFEPGGKSALHRHPHQHGVVVLQGRGRVLLGDEWHAIGPGDAICTGSDELHQFEATGPEPFGFICVIPAWAEADACTIPLRTE